MTESNLVLHSSRAKKGSKDARDDGQYIVPSGPKCFGCQGFDHIKQECLREQQDYWEEQDTCSYIERH